MPSTPPQPALSVSPQSLAAAFATVPDPCRAGSVIYSSVRVPLTMAGPGIRAGQWISELVWHGDTTATLLELTGNDPAVAADGRSLAPALRGDELADWREYVGAAYRFTQRSV